MSIKLVFVNFYHHLKSKLFGRNNSRQQVFPVFDRIIELPLKNDERPIIVPKPFILDKWYYIFALIFVSCIITAYLGNPIIVFYSYVFYAIEIEDTPQNLFIATLLTQCVFKISTRFVQGSERLRVLLICLMMSNVIICLCIEYVLIN